jgi:hypothetical protein
VVASAVGLEGRVAGKVAGKGFGGCLVSRLPSRPVIRLCSPRAGAQGALLDAEAIKAGKQPLLGTRGQGA